MPISKCISMQSPFALILTIQIWATGRPFLIRPIFPIKIRIRKGSTKCSNTSPCWQWQCRSWQLLLTERRKNEIKIRGMDYLFHVRAHSNPANRYFARRITAFPSITWLHCIANFWFWYIMHSLLFLAFEWTMTQWYYRSFLSISLLLIKFQIEFKTIF